MDMCECICTFQNAMRRLVEVLNRAQNYCSDDGAGDGHQVKTNSQNQNILLFSESSSSRQFLPDDVSFHDVRCCNVPFTTKQKPRPRPNWKAIRRPRRLQRRTTSWRTFNIKIQPSKSPIFSSLRFISFHELFCHRKISHTFIFLKILFVLEKNVLFKIVIRKK